MAAAAQSSRFAAVLLAVAERLRTQLDLDDSRVVVVKGGGYATAFVGETHLRVRPLRAVYFGDAGAGRYGMPVTRTVAVDVWTRGGGVDSVGEDEFALTEADSGHFDVEEAVADALVLWTPLDDADAPLTVEPLHPTAADDPDAPEPQRDAGYLLSTIYFEAKTVAKLTVS